MIAPALRRRPIFASDIRRLGGVVTVIGDRDRIDGARFYRVSYRSGGGDLTWTSPPIHDEDAASEAARAVAAFVGGTVRT